MQSYNTLTTHIQSFNNVITKTKIAYNVINMHHNHIKFSRREFKEIISVNQRKLIKCKGKSESNILLRQMFVKFG